MTRIIGGRVTERGVMFVRTHRDLVVWQRGMEAAIEIYALVGRLPKHERPGLASQMRRAAASIPANIAEGAGRVHRGDYLRFISIARGSQMELDTHLELAVRLGYLSDSEVAKARAMLEQTGKMLSTLSRVLSKDKGSQDDKSSQ